MRSILYVILVLTLASHFHANDTSLYAGEKLDLETVLDNMDLASMDFKSIDADVTYTRIIFLLDEEEVAEGTLRYKIPRKLRLEFEPPRDEIDVSDGKYFWIYKPGEKQVEQYRLAEGETTELNFFEFGYEGSVEKARKNYIIEMVPNSDAEADDESIYVLKLTPKPSMENPQYNEIMLWVDDGIWLPVRMDLYESDGEVINRIELWDIKINEAVDDDVFEFKVPPGVEVVEPL
ncbi:MAG: LolA family protein [Planctomycetota bacterium]|jgi:outer membrane lipoprotein-sorting protein